MVGALSERGDGRAGGMYGARNDQAEGHIYEQ